VHVLDGGDNDRVESAVVDLARACMKGDSGLEGPVPICEKRNLRSGEPLLIVQRY
jgi:hypothetical protein